MSSATLSEHGAHAVSIAAIGYAALPSTAHDPWVLGGAAVFSLAFEAIRRIRPVKPSALPTSEPLEAAKSMVERGMSTVETLAEAIRPPETLPPEEADSSVRKDAEDGGNDEDDADGDILRWRTWGWLAGNSRILAMFMASYQNPISMPELIALLRQVQQQEKEKAARHSAGSKEHAFHRGASFAWGNVAAMLDPTAPPETGP